MALHDPERGRWSLRGIRENAAEHDTRATTPKRAAFTMRAQPQRNATSPSRARYEHAVLRDEGYLLIRGRAGACIADFQQTATPERLAASAARLAEQLYRLALEHSAQGGTEEQFVEAARREAERAFADPGIAGAARDMRVLGLDAAGNRLVPRNAGENAASSASAGARPASTAGPERTW